MGGFHCISGDIMTRFKLSEIANIAEIIGTLALIISLVFVGLQIRQNTAQTKLAAAQAVHDNYAGWYTSMQSDPILLTITTKGMQDYSVLSPSERAQFIAVFMAFTSHSQNAFYKFRDGSLSPELWQAWVYVSMNFLNTPGGKAFWKERDYVFSQPYQDYVRDVILTTTPHPKAKPWGAFELNQRAQ